MQVMGRIEVLKGQTLPWEGACMTTKTRKRLRLFHDSIMALLSRDPSQLGMRPCARQHHDKRLRALSKIPPRRHKLPSMSSPRACAAAPWCSCDE